MRGSTFALRRLPGFCLLLWAAAGAGAAQAADNAAVERGRYLVHAAGCVACHSDAKGGGAPLSGGRALATPFGTFYTPNLTPDPETGLGRWDLADFDRALRRGRDPQSRAYYPAFPFTAYAGMTEGDVADLWAYLRSLPPAVRPNREHELSFPFSLRLLAAGIWQALFFEARPFAPEPARDDIWNRGAYLVRHLGHCGECHSPRNALGAIDPGRELAGTLKGPDGKKVPNITPHDPDGIDDWRESDITFMLKLGFLPDGDYVGGAMEEVVSQGSSKLTDEDRAAIATYLLALPPLPGP